MSLGGNRPEAMNFLHTLPPGPLPSIFTRTQRGRAGRLRDIHQGPPDVVVPVQPGEVVEHSFSDTAEETLNGSPPGKDDGTEGEQGATEGAPGVNGVSPTEPPGTRLEVKRVDEVFDRKRTEWIVKDSVVSTKKSKKDAYGAFAFTVNRKFHPTPDPTLHVITTTIDIKSPYIKTAGMHVIKQVQGISWTSKPLKVDPQILLAFLPQLQAYVDALRAQAEQTEEEASIVAHVDFLLAFLRAEHGATLDELASLHAHGETTFELLWALLVPRTVLYSPCPITGAPRAVRLTHAELCSRGQGPNFWRLDVEYVECTAGAAGTGQKFGLAALQNLEITSFKGAARITSLPAYPLKWYSGVEELTSRIIERGKKWAALEGVHHMHYKGTGFHFKDGRHIKLNLNCRIMVDWKTFAQTMPNYELPTVIRTLSGEDVDRHHRGQAVVQTASETEPQLEDADLLLTSPIVYGFSLADKLWLEFDVDNVGPFVWNDEAFVNLVLPRDQKTLIRSLVEAHSVGLSAFDDFVEGKGRGLVINLFGNPGVGKSLTAEATSEYVRKPLYVVGAGDLGTSAALLDANLTRIFSISANWGAVVLIDEADVFLEERSFHDLERNAMVAVFLRQLEYFRGILFLTTNRVRTFDEAFQSRIHVALRYQDLTADAKRQIWAAFLAKARGGAGAGLSADELHELGEKRVNGRQIKNVVRTAAALAVSRREELGYRHLIQVLDMMEQFDASNAMYQ